MKKLSTITLLSLSIIGSAGAATVSIDFSQNAPSAETQIVDLTAQGNLDWASWSTQNIVTPANAKDGGTGLSFGLLPGTAAYGSSFGGSGNTYSWTDGSPTAVGSDTHGFRSVSNANGEGFRIIAAVAAAGVYRLTVYAAS